MLHPGASPHLNHTERFQSAKTCVTPTISCHVPHVWKGNPGHCLDLIFLALDTRTMHNSSASHTHTHTFLPSPYFSSHTRHSTMEETQLPSTGLLCLHREGGRQRHRKIKRSFCSSAIIHLHRPLSSSLLYLSLLFSHGHISQQIPAVLSDLFSASLCSSPSLSSPLSECLILFSSGCLLISSYCLPLLL